MRDGRARLGAWWERFFDIVATATVISVVTILLVHGAFEDPYFLAISLGLLTAGVVLLVLRRRYPMVAAIGSTVTSALALLVPDTAIAVWVLAEICIFTLTLRRNRTAAITVGAIHAGILYAGALIAFAVAPWDPLALILPVWTGAVVAFGIALHTQQNYVDALEERARTAATIREGEVLRHVGVERLRIARDLHDSVANAIAVINLESSTATRHLTDAPDRAARSLDTIRGLTRATLSELSDILAVLRDDPDDPDRTVATAANIPHLIELLTTAGMVIDADLREFADLRVDPVVDAALYRVAQEALTNAHRYSLTTSPVILRAVAGGQDITLTVSNQIDPDRLPRHPGFGLIGMRERVEHAAGTLHAGAQAGRFTVTAHLPRTSHLTESTP